MSKYPMSSSDEQDLVSRPQGGYRRAVVIVVLSLIAVVLAVGLLLVLRRLTGDLTGRLPWGWMLLTAILATAALTSARIAWRRCFPLKLEQPLPPADMAVGWGSSAALILLAVGCCYPGYHNSDWLIWLPLLLADQFWRQSFFDSGHPELGIRKPEEPDRSVALLSEADSNSASGEVQDIVQQIFRLRNDAGYEVVYGTLRADFQPGQRTAVAHVGFCPPLDYRPEIEAEALPGKEARIKVVQALAHGVRIDVKLRNPAAEACHLWIDMAATPPSESAEKLTA